MLLFTRSLCSSHINTVTQLPATLLHVDLSGNGLTRLDALKSLASLQWLDASHNALKVHPYVTVSKYLHAECNDPLNGGLATQWQPKRHDTVTSRSSWQTCSSSIAVVQLIPCS